MKQKTVVVIPKGMYASVVPIPFKKNPVIVTHYESDDYSRIIITLHQ